MKSSVEIAFVRDLCQAERRVDARAFDESRQLRIELAPNSYGQVEASLGRTTVLVKTSCVLGRPFAERPHEGVVTFATAYSFELADRKQRCASEAALSRLVEKAFRESKAIDRESLCVIAGQSAWHCKVDIHVLQDDGNVLQLTSLAVLAALLSFRRPDVLVVGNCVSLFGMRERNPVGLGMLHLPVCVSVGYLAATGSFMLDLTAAEEAACDALLLFCVNGQREFTPIWKCGGVGLPIEQFLYAASLACSQAARLLERLKQQLAASQF